MSYLPPINQKSSLESKQSGEQTQQQTQSADQNQISKKSKLNYFEAQEQNNIQKQNKIKDQLKYHQFYQQMTQQGKNFSEVLNQVYYQEQIRLVNLNKEKEKKQSEISQKQSYQTKKKSVKKHKKIKIQCSNLLSYLPEQMSESCVNLQQNQKKEDEKQNLNTSFQPKKEKNKKVKGSQKDLNRTMMDQNYTIQNNKKSPFLEDNYI